MEFIKKIFPFFILLIIGCATTNNGKLKVPQTFFNPYYPEKKTVIEPGDVLTIRFYYHPELDEKLIVRPDGKISLLFYQGMKVSGLTPEQLQKKLIKLYSKEFREPIISVNLTKRGNYKIFIAGEVSYPGEKDLVTNMTVAQLLIQTGVKIRNADLQSVILVRQLNKKSYKAYKLDARIKNGKDRDIYLKPGDIVFVPRNRITKFGDFVQKYIRNIIPPAMTLGLGFTYELHSETKTVK